MKKLSLLGGTVALLLVGCASDHQHYARYHNSTDYYGENRAVVTEPESRVIIKERDGRRTYVREYDSRYDNHDYNNPRWNYRGKHPDSLGWNDPYWNR